MGELSRESYRDELDFGPWWWRLRCWLSQRALELGIWLEPDDKSSTHWLNDDGETITIATVRRRRYA